MHMKNTLLYLLPLLMLFTCCKEVKTNNTKDDPTNVIMVDQPDSSATSISNVGPKDGICDVFVLDGQTLVGFIEAKECNVVLDYVLGNAALSYEPDATIYNIENQRTAITVLKGEKLKIARNGIGSVRISYHYNNQ